MYLKISLQFNKNKTDAYLDIRYANQKFTAAQFSVLAPI